MFRNILELIFQLRDFSIQNLYIKLINRINGHIIKYLIKKYFKLIKFFADRRDSRFSNF